MFLEKIQVNFRELLLTSGRNSPEINFEFNFEAEAACARDDLVSVLLVNISIVWGVKEAMFVLK